VSTLLPLANRSLPLGGRSGLSVMANADDRRHESSSHRAASSTACSSSFLLLLPLADDHPFADGRLRSHAERGSTTAYRVLPRAPVRRPRALACIFLFLMAGSSSLGVHAGCAVGVMSAILGWTLPVTVSRICVPMIVAPRSGGCRRVRLDRRERCSSWSAVSAGGAILDLRQKIPSGTSAFGQALHLAAPPAGRRDRLPGHLTETLPFVRACSAAVPMCSPRLRLRPQTGAALT